ncbi:MULTISPECIES: hypothetical protein [unclassified Mesorhizobium]|uniref:hypothetical protein n=1 Tax=unclassified Mesorhizobium TaxID=325217 RepID=UPI000FC99DA8|nr:MULTISPECIES: hypothetical protein [unclassified Mesorhizobium]RVD10051.1 hypothetical protein EN749_31715 [Mesorhizobium sp. M7A.F.Ca.ET.027.02.1.1]RVD53960.1 hypothetical protein EN750_26230 [Mesorhizobium sp. M7A.F.Ca.ET.027.03.2.1]RWD04943.1 MAG: hypothetical protein EOS73_19965 [Mesorhizobium sp.]RWQ14497.1 MAG: hypothetical protein EOR93_29080 [Mesorhizobium sp.]
MQPDDQLQRLIDDCYAAFAPYPRPHAIHASPLRNPVALLKTLSSAPLRELTGDQIGPYAGYAMTTVGDVDDYKHFLPRILEQAIRDQQWTGTDPSIIAERLKKGKWLDWPLHEQAAIRALFAGALSQALQEDPDEEEADSWICGIACLDLDLAAMLGRWLAAPSINATLQLANFMQSGANFVFENDTTERALWSHVDEAKIHQMRRWLLSLPVHQLLLTARGRAAPSRLRLINKGLEALASFDPTSMH